MSKFKVNDLVEVIDKDAIYGCSNLNWVRPRVSRVNGKEVFIIVDDGEYKFYEHELLLYELN